MKSKHITREEYENQYNNYKDYLFCLANEEMYKKNKDLQTRINKAVEYIEYIIERFNKINDKELISNRLVDIECIEELYDILRGEE